MNNLTYLPGRNTKVKFMSRIVEKNLCRSETGSETNLHVWSRFEKEIISDPQHCKWRCLVLQVICPHLITALSQNSVDSGGRWNTTLLRLVVFLVSRAVDPDSLNLDPDPAFQVYPDLDPSRIQGFDDQNWRKKIQQKIFYISFLIKNHKLLVSKLQRSLQPSKENIQNMTFINFFLCLWVIFALLDPDPDTDPGTLFGSGSTHCSWVSVGTGICCTGTCCLASFTIAVHKPVLRIRRVSVSTKSKAKRSFFWKISIYFSKYWKLWRLWRWRES